MHTRCPIHTSNEYPRLVRLPNIRNEVVCVPPGHIGNRRSFGHGHRRRPNARISTPRLLNVPIIPSSMAIRQHFRRVGSPKTQHRTAQGMHGAGHSASPACDHPSRSDDLQRTRCGRVSYDTTSDTRHIVCILTLYNNRVCTARGAAKEPLLLRVPALWGTAPLMHRCSLQQPLQQPAHLHAPRLARQQRPQRSV